MIAKTEEARFEWWIQTKFVVLPTDPRYLDMTQEQFELMYQHFLIDNPPGKSEDDDDGKARDDGYDEEEGALAEHRAIEEEGLPLEDNESYRDPDFMDEWNNLDEESEEDSILDKGLIEENPSGEEFLDVGEGNVSDTNEPISIYNEEEWKEVD